MEAQPELLKSRYLEGYLLLFTYVDDVSTDPNSVLIKNFTEIMDNLSCSQICNNLKDFRCLLDKKEQFSFVLEFVKQTFLKEKLIYPNNLIDLLDLFIRYNKLELQIYLKTVDAFNKDPEKFYPVQKQKILHFFSRYYYYDEKFLSLLTESVISNKTYYQESFLSIITNLALLNF